MGFEKQTLFDRCYTHKDKISDVINIKKHGFVSKVRKVQFLNDIELYLPENFLCEVNCTRKDNTQFTERMNFYDIPYFEDDIDDIAELRYTFINLNPYVINIDNDDLKIVIGDIAYMREYDAFMAGVSTFIYLHIINNKIDTLNYNYMYRMSNGSEFITENTIWIYDYGEYIND